MSIHTGYEYAKAVCSGAPTTGARGAMAWFLGAYASQGGENLGIYNCRSIRGGITPSIHGEGRAVDFGINPNSAQYGTILAERLRKVSRELGIQCIIWNRQIWSGLTASWQPYNGSNPHVDHLHVELTRAAAARSAIETTALWERTLNPPKPPAVVPAASIAHKVWPYVTLAKVTAHTSESHGAWVELMRRTGYRDADLGVALQKWLAKLGYYDRAIDRNFGEHSVIALQRCLAARGYYKGRIDGDRGSMTVAAEIAYLNAQGALIRRLEGVK